MDTHIPLPELLRPKTLDDVIGQDHLVGKNGILRRMLEAKFLPSLILWGPPGTGKTTIARLLSEHINSLFIAASAVTTKLDDVRRIVKESKERLQTTKQRTILFIDELHRFNKAQQDAFLPHVEDGTIIFIGATTENPSFEVISPLLSRCRVLVVKPLEEQHLLLILKKALEYVDCSIDPDAKDFLLTVSNGDARSLLTIIEIASALKSEIRNSKREIILKKKVQNPKFNSSSISKVQSLKEIKSNTLTIKKSNILTLTLSDIEEAAQKKMLNYDRAGDEHYNTISAFIKSMRASQTDAALYYLARMVAAGEDALFIARRMVIFASEDIGVVTPTALVVANAVFDGCHKVGYPEAQILLAHGVTYLCGCKKDRSAYDAFFRALEDVKKYGNLPIPKNILNAPTKFMKSLDYGKGYTMYDGGSYLPEKLKRKKYFSVIKSSS